MQWQTISFDTLASTNLEAKRLIQSQASAQSLHGTVITAESQTGGKGRLGRAWESPKSTGLWFTAIIEPRTTLAETSLYLFCCGSVYLLPD